MRFLLVDVFRACVWLMLLTAVFVTLERLFSLRPHRVLRPQVLVDLGYFFLSSLLPSGLLDRRNRILLGPPADP